MEDLLNSIRRLYLRQGRFQIEGFEFTNLNHIRVAIILLQEDDKFDEFLSQLSTIQEEINQPCSLMWTPIMFAAYLQMPGKCAILLKHGADIKYNHPDPDLGWNCIYTCIRFFNDFPGFNNSDTLHFLLDETDAIIHARSVVEFLERDWQESTSSQDVFCKLISKCVNIFDEVPWIYGTLDVPLISVLQMSFYRGKNTCIDACLKLFPPDQRVVHMKQVYKFLVDCQHYFRNYEKDEEEIMFQDGFLKRIIVEGEIDFQCEVTRKITNAALLNKLLRIAGEIKTQYEKQLQENYILKRVLAQSYTNALVAQVLTFVGAKRQKIIAEPSPLMLM